MWVDVCSSTNDLIREMGEKGAPHGSWVAAKKQTCGRGRAGRKWESQEGNLFFSLLVRDVPRPLWSWVPLGTAVGIAEELNLDIKWPNDLWLRGKKAGGILCESAKDFIGVGIGLNCADAPRGLDQETAALGLDRDEVFPRVKDAVLRALSDLVSAGEDKMRKRFEARSVFKPGSEITWKKHHGIFLGLGPSGELRVRKASGEEVSLFSEDVGLA